MKLTSYPLFLFIIFISCCSSKLSQEETLISRSKPFPNLILEHNRYLDDMLKKEKLPSLALRGKLKDIGIDGEYGYETITISDEQLKREIISNLFLDDSIFEVNEDGTATLRFCSCEPDVTILFPDFSFDNEVLTFYYYMEAGSNVEEIFTPILWSRPLDKQKAEQLEKIFSELGLIDPKQR